MITIFGEIRDPYTGEYKVGPMGFGAFINNIVNAVTIVAGLLLFAYLIMGGFRYVTAGGDEKAVMSAKNMMTNAAVGLLIIVAAYFIAGIVGVILGIDILEPVFKGP